jgi:hypothetical protein
MTGFIRLRLAIVAGLLLAATSCQRAGYSFHSPPGALAGPTGYLPDTEIAAPVHTLPAPIATPPGQAGNGQPSFRFRRVTPIATAGRQPFHALRHPLMPSKRPLLRSHSVKRTRRLPTITEDTKVILLGTAAVLALLAGGIFLVSAVAGWLALTGGILLIVTGVVVGLFLLYAFLFGSQSMR